MRTLDEKSSYQLKAKSPNAKGLIKPNMAGIEEAFEEEVSGNVSRVSPRQIALNYENTATGGDPDIRRSKTTPSTPPLREPLINRFEEEPDGGFGIQGDHD